MTADEHPSTFDAIVVGAGVIGLAVAWRASESGLRVATVDPAPGHGASWAAAGMLAPVSEAHYGEEALLQLTLASASRFPSFVDELEQRSGRAAGYRREGTLAVALDADDRAALDALHAFQRRLGLSVETLTSRECRRLEPMLTPTIRGGLLVEDDHSVDNRLFTSALLEAADKSGVQLIQRSVRRLVAAADRASGVVLDDGTMLTADNVVLAAGCWSGAIEGVPGGVLPAVRPVKGQILRLRAPAAMRPFLTRTVRGTVRGSSVYLVPRDDGELVLGATVEEQGFDTRVTAGGVYELLRDAHTLLPGITELALEETLAGLRPGSPDNAPLLGATALPGLLLATGHYRNGILLAPVTGDAIAQLLASGSLPEVAAPFSADRFVRTEVPA